jgi:CBS domain containing-hemolysin-like protein
VIIELLVWAVLLVVAGGVFAAADSAIGIASRARVDELVHQGRVGARQLARVLADRPRHLHLLLLLRLVCELTATVLVTVVALRLSPSSGWGVVAAILIMVVVSSVLVGVGPRTIGRLHPYPVALAVAAPVRFLARLFGPLIRLLILVGNLVTSGRGFREGSLSTEVELRELVDMARERGVVAPGQRDMIHSVFELGDTLAREVMVPRTEIVWIERTKTVRQALTLCLRSGFSRVPVIGDSVDDIVGVVTIKDLAQVVADSVDRAGSQRAVAEVMRPASFVPDSKRLDQLLREMQLSRSHLAIAVDEYGGTAGLLTIEDIIEEIVGEITDESDLTEHRPVEWQADGMARVSSRLPVEDLGDLFDVELDDSEVETVGGLLAQHLGRVPLPGAEAEIRGLRLRAEGDKDHRGRIRINALLVWRDTARSDAPQHGADQEGNIRG